MRRFAMYSRDWRIHFEREVTVQRRGAHVHLLREYARTFNNAGTFNYQCALHGASMSGSVIVQP